MTQALDSTALDQLFLAARTYNKFTTEPVSDDLLKQLYDLYKWGPTSMNTQPGRVVFVRSVEGKERLKPALMPNNVEKTMAAPVVAIVAFDSTFYEHMPTQFPANPGARDMFANNAGLSAETASRNSALQGAYLIMAARALGLAAGPMSGFNPAAVNEAFFPDGRLKVNFLINLGWGDPSGNRPRGPRLAFEDSVVMA
ncbi:MAG: malonic semialdehyde reductase [Curvibacter lanceolatus]|jgi:nitroreductase|uniref:malonic semialdehyde reductase n=1 Tax=Curvibacter lanceolatus TaxID=86182 RepID=UPI0003627FED|nr:malonic semialdehyde reductase [Curvibacter lanceolatus]MBV5292006.1 malonic semialdehyde reductase [Curvibacter lanceolatus]